MRVWTTRSWSGISARSLGARPPGVRGARISSRIGSSDSWLEARRVLAASAAAAWVSCGVSAAWTRTWSSWMAGNARPASGVTSRVSAVPYVLAWVGRPAVRSARVSGPLVWDPSRRSSGVYRRSSWSRLKTSSDHHHTDDDTDDGTDNTAEGTTELPVCTGHAWRPRCCGDGLTEALPDQRSDGGAGRRVHTNCQSRFQIVCHWIPPSWIRSATEQRTLPLGSLSCTT
jgi:hypothetical protein